MRGATSGRGGARGWGAGHSAFAGFTVRAPRAPSPGVRRAADARSDSGCAGGAGPREGVPGGVGRGTRAFLFLCSERRGVKKEREKREKTRRKCERE